MIDRRQMMNYSSVLVTGASSGIGRACAELLAARGYSVFGVARQFSPGIHRDVRCFEADVNDEESIGQTIEKATQASGGVLDVIINAAGFAVAGPIEVTPIEDARAQFETNFFGVVRVSQMVLPSMRRKRRGLIVNIGSMAGFVALPYQGFYAASKFALEGYSETLAMEVRAFNVHVTLVEPGDFRTEFTAKRRHVPLAAMDADYREPFEETITAVAQSEMDAPEPHRVAELVASILDDPAPKIRYPIASPHRIAYVTRDLLAKAEVVKAAVPALKDREQRS
jgi:short-subunit dehydrogenase